MAEITLEGTKVTVSLSHWEQLGSVHGNISIDRSQIAGVHRRDDLWDELRGFRAPGTGVPNQIMIGTTRHKGLKDFCAVYAHKPGVVIDLRDHEFSRILVTSDHADELVARLAATSEAPED